MAKGRYEQQSLSVIEKRAAEYEGDTLAGMKKYINSYYPFGMRKYHPYRMWLRTLNRYMEERAKMAKLSGKQEGLF